MARSVRNAGLATFAFGGAMLTHVSTWIYYQPAVAVRIHGGPSFTLSLQAVAGVVAVVAGPVLFVAGRWMLQRADAAAASNPVTAGISDETVPP